MPLSSRPGDALTTSQQKLKNVTERDAPSVFVNANQGVEIDSTAMAGPASSGLNTSAFMLNNGQGQELTYGGDTQTWTEGGGDVSSLAKASGTEGALVSYARQFIGTPYKWGGTAPGGFDCSGFLQYVYKKFGVSMPRVSYQQAQTGVGVAKGSQQVGDLIWWDNSSRNNGADHVAMYIGNGYIIEAPRAGVPVRIRKLGNSENFGVRRVMTGLSQSTNKTTAQ